MTEKHDLFIIGIVAIVAIVASVMLVINNRSPSIMNSVAQVSTGITGQVIVSANQVSKPLEPQNSCSDSDGGIVLEDYGIVQGAHNSVLFEYSDYCKDEHSLMEYYCYGNTKAEYESSCEYGCQHGACMEDFLSTQI
jgi:hypothetical protein